jgi:hypothetical protein
MPEHPGSPLLDALDPLWIGPGVIVAMAVAGSATRWKGERSRAERLGRVVVLFWLAALAWRLWLVHWY